MKNLTLLLFVLLTYNYLSGQNVYIPDANFKTYLINNTAINTNEDEEISIEEAEAFTGEISVSSDDITDLTGIEAFKNVTRLRCGSNDLTSLDVSNNLALAYLDCSYNDLTFINISNNINLEYFSCYGNNIASLDISKNLDLNTLIIGANALTSIDVTQHTALSYLNARDNLLTNVDVSNNFNLLELDVSVNLLTSLNVSNNIHLTELNCYINDILSLDVTNNTALTSLNCDRNELTVLDVTQNTALTRIDCDTNAIEQLDVSNCTQLTQLYVYNNSLAFLDISNCMVLEDLRCNNNNLTELNLANGNNENLRISSILFLSFKDNPDLTCIQVDDDIYSNTYWSEFKDTTASYSTSCHPILTTTAENGTITVDLPPSNGSTYSFGDVITLTAIPDTNYIFSHWEEDTSGTETSLEITMDTDKNITAVFIEDSSLSIVDDAFNDTIDFYPNPVHEKLSISIPNKITISSIKLLDLNGKEIINTTHPEIDLISIYAGLYLLKIESETGQISVKKVLKN